MQDAFIKWAVIILFCILAYLLALNFIHYVKG